MTIERIAAAIKPILDEDRRADRVRIAELERDGRVLQLDLKIARDQLDELDEKCVALLAENKRLLESTVRNHSGASLSMLIESELKASQRTKPEAPTLRIDTDMSDPQPGKLLVVRLEKDDVGRAWMLNRAPCNRGEAQPFWPSQLVGFLVETPAVEVKRTPKVGDKVRLTVSGWEGETAKIVGIKEQSAALSLDDDGGNVKRFSFDCFEVIE